MADETRSRRRFGVPRAAMLGLGFMVASGCAEGDRVGPSAETETAVGGGQAAAATQPGIVFSFSQLATSQINSTYTGMVFTATPSNILSTLSQVKAKGGRVLLKLAGENTYKDPGGKFNLTKWKTQVDRYKNINITPYITDGTIVGHFLVDEPHFDGRWGGSVIPQATLEEAAKHSKQYWPTLPTIVNAPANWLASASVNYVNLDAGWAMFRSKTATSASSWAAQQVKRAKSKGLGLVAGMNILDGGDGSSGIRGTQPKTWAMSAAELREYGNALLNQSYVCAFSMWRYDAAYFNRTDIKNALAELSAKARTHAKTACRQ